jgi:hypothetical protein
VFSPPLELQAANFRGAAAAPKARGPWVYVKARRDADTSGRHACRRFAVQSRFRARRVRTNKMLRSPKKLFVILALAAATAQPSYAQDKSQDKNKDPRVVVELDKRAATNDSKAKEPTSSDGSTHLSPDEPFGKACSAFGAAKDGYRNFDRPFAVNELFGAPIAVVIIRRLGSGQEKPDRDELRKHIVEVLNAQTSEVSRYVDWDEFVPPGIVATIQFADRSKGVLEESGGHVCFSDYAGTVWWLRIPVESKPQP